MQIVGLWMFGSKATKSVFETANGDFQTVQKMVLDDHLSFFGRFPVDSKEQILAIEESVASGKR